MPSRLPRRLLPERFSDPCFSRKLRPTMLAFLIFGAFVTGAGYLSHSWATIARQPERRAAGQQPPSAAKFDPPAIPTPDQSNQGATPGRMIVNGRVVDSAGEARAERGRYGLRAAQTGRQAHTVRKLELCCDRSIALRRGGPVPDRRHAHIVLPRMTWSALPRFRTRFQYRLVRARPRHRSARDPTSHFSPSNSSSGRLFDLQGRPAQGVHINVWSIIHRPQDLPLGSPIRFEMANTTDLTAWPGPATSDNEGRFTLHGMGRGLWVNLVVNDPRFASQIITVGTEGTVDSPRFGQQIRPIKLDGNSDSTPLTIALQPARMLTGRVTYADTGKPVANALIQTNTSAYAPEIRTGKEGQFRASLSTIDEFGVTVYPPDGEPYLLTFNSFIWPKGAVEQSHDMVLPRGVMIHGRVTEAGSDAPVAGAVLRFRPCESPDNIPHTSSPSTTMPDGRFQIAVDPSPGYLEHPGLQRRLCAPRNRRTDGPRRKARW